MNATMTTATPLYEPSLDGSTVEGDDGPTLGGFTADEILAREAESYRCWGSDLGLLLADAVEGLRLDVRATETTLRGLHRSRLAELRASATCMRGADCPMREAGEGL